MSIELQLTRITNDRNKIRAKAVELGIAQDNASLDDLATAIEAIENKGSVSATVKEGDTYTIPKGYHNGSGTVSGVGGGGSYTLQSKTVTPTKAQQNIVPDGGYYGLSDVTVAPIPTMYQDVSGVTAAAGDVLANKVIVDAKGKQVAGTMANNGAVKEVLTVEAAAYTVPAGYHDGKGTVSVSLEEKAAAPTKAPQDITPTVGKVLSKVTIAAIPAEFQDVSGVTAEAGDVLTGKKIVGTDGSVIEGAMANNGAITTAMDGLTVTSYKIPAGFTSGGTVTLTGDIESRLAAI